MAGHNKWSKIKRKKGVADARRGKLFSRMIKEIMVAVRESGSVPEDNPRLRTAIQNAKGVNMPKENIQRAINKASEGGGADYIETTYEGYGPGGVALFVECTTDNTNRSVADVRHLFDKYEGSLSKNGAVDYLFARKGIFTIAKAARQSKEEDALVLGLIDAGAEEVDTEGDIIIVTTPMEDFGPMQDKLAAMGVEPEHSALHRIPHTTITVDEKAGRKVIQLIEALEDIEDVQQVFHNMEMTAALVAATDD